VRSIAARDSRVRLLDNPGRIQARALNLAIAEATGDVIARIDGHTLVAPDYVRRCVEALEATGADTVGGPLHSAGLTPMGRAIAVAYCSPFGVPSRYRISRRAEFVDQVYLGAWRREVFERVGLFDPSLAVNEDYEHNYRVRRAGGRVFLTPAIHSTYYGRQTLGGLWRQYMRYGAGKLRVMATYPRSTRLRHLVAPLFVLALLLGGIVAPFSAGVLWGFRAVLGSYALVNGAATLIEARRTGWALVWRLPAAFAVMHVAWGVGFWIGLVLWVTRRR